jgi:hypothetical protein
MLQVEQVLHHLLTTVSKMFRRVAIAFGSVFIIAIAVTEGLAAVLTKQFPPSGLTHVVAVIIGFSLGLNVALAVGIEEGLRGFIALIRDVAKVTEEAAVKVAREVEKEGGQLLHAAEHEASNLAHGVGGAVQGIERGAVTAVRDVAEVPGRVIGGIERRITGQGTEQSS